MKKEKILLSFLVFVLGCLSFNASAYSQDELISIARKASYEAAKNAMSQISPNTGQDADYDLDYESVIYDSYEKEIECQVKLTWNAKNRVLFGSWGTCEMWGKLYIDLSNGKSKMKTRFIPKGNNSWCKTCADSHGYDLAASILFTIALSN